jgi:Transcriptional regulator
VLLPSDHPLTAKTEIELKDLRHEKLIAMAGKANVLRKTIDAYLRQAGVEIDIAQSVDNPAMVMSLIASIRGITLIPAYVQNLMPWSVASRPLAGNVPSIDLVIGYSASNSSPILKRFLERIEDLAVRIDKTHVR